MGQFGQMMQQGSPPHMRGKDKPMITLNFDEGITPAHAGKSEKIWRLQRPLQDHPRTCGEKNTQGEKADTFKGSPPHMRGKACGKDENDGHTGITPAHAGKSAKWIRIDTIHGDHPRTCGEKGSKEEYTWKKLGSPPHMRGKVRHTDRSDKPMRITPAHAGKSTGLVTRWGLF